MQRMQRTQVWSAAAIGLILTACGGGGGSDSPTVSPQLISGVVATGAPVVGATVKVFDSRGLQVGTGTTGDDGSFTVTLTATGTAPYVLHAEKDEIAMTAISSAAGNGRVNVTPVSDAVVTLLYPQSPDVVSLLRNGATAPSAEEVAAKQALLRAALAPLLTAVGTSTDPFTGTFSANGTGFDKVLDTLVLNKSVDGSGASSVELTFKTATDPTIADADQPTIKLTNTIDLETVNTQAAGVSIAKSDLPPDNAGALYKDFIDRANACYREPVAARTDGSTTVTASVCRSLFVDADPTRFRHGGSTVRAGGAWGGMFTYTGTVEFKPVTRAYLVQDLAGTRSQDSKGRAIIAMSWINSDGNRENILQYVTKYTLNGKEMLGASGDQNTYGFSVNSHNQKREFPLRAAPDLDYVTGNWLIVVNDVIASGASIIEFVRVTSPSGKLIVMAPGKGGAQRDLQICKRGEVVNDATRGLIPSQTDAGAVWCSGSKAITVTERFVTSGDTRLPSVTLTNAGIIRPLQQSGADFVPYTPGDAEVSSWKSLGLWRAEYHFRDGRPVVTQRTWSVARPMTTTELLGPSGPDQQMGKLTNIDAIKALKSTSVLAPCHPTDATCVAAEQPVPMPSSGGMPMTWSDSSVPITSLWVSGAINGKLYNVNPSLAEYKTWVSSLDNTTSGASPQTRATVRWDDQRTVSSSTKSAQVMCSRLSTADTHCASTVNSGQSGGYNPNTWMSYSELWGKDADQRSLMRSYNWYRPTVAN
jgi:hypothetical protein